MNKITLKSMINIIVLLTCTLLISTTAYAGPAPKKFTVAQPKVGLVLSGGGAKGSAHVGVLKYLEQQHIKVDYIVGTSIGAYVGGLYALGYSADDIKTIMLALDWESGFNDKVPRQSLRYRDKQDFDRYNMPFELGLLDGNLLLPKGVLRGQTMGNLYVDSFGAVPHQTSFSQLAIPFSAIATDIATGEAVILSQGDLLKAMQASATVPGVLQPTVIDGKALVDGGIVNNLPADTAKEMGADIVIAVDIGADLSKQKQLDSTIAIISQLSTIMTRANAVEQIAQLADGDILIRPDVSHFDTTDFSSLASGFTLGQKAAAQQHKALNALRCDSEEYNDYQHKKSAFKQTILDFQQATIDQIVINNDTAISTALIKQKLDIEEGDIKDKQALIDAIDNVYALNNFEKVTVDFEQDEAGTKTLILNADTKSWGPNFFDIGFSWQEDFENVSNVSLDLAYQLNNIAGTKSQMRFELTTGDDKLLATELYLPLGKFEQFFVKARYQYQQQHQTYYDQNNPLIRTTQLAHRLHTAIGFYPIDNMILEVGLYLETGDIEGPLLPQVNFDYDAYGSFIHLGYDSLDSFNFPTEGMLFEANIIWHNDKPSDQAALGYQSLTEYNINVKKAISYQQHTLIAKVDLGGIDTDDINLIHTQKLGGFLNLSGAHNDSLVGSQLAYGALIYQHRMDWRGLGINIPIYLGGSIEAGNVWQRKDQRDISDLIYAASVFVGTETDFGPAVFGFGMNDQHHKSVYLTLGKRF